ncbi:MAG: HyaD/HybD family hydrogenase maturation endopeptidase [Candidatus Thiodiazotropha taylori]|nr:HyaD/HybD family hydrogenase maturation endopeptidase [Candidatus Thiodiazotropha taylori]MCG8113475.1 HyaD/HybD family hydrogenase maturation endopeptidase [Candidatus Thiodiazotropha taylori]MCG8123651.1 HyaD/HybD family hydrogenase maturation endopeptidase [Candidatus Thiodiazotropha taylori]MCW4252390.1 HyaD/HybD family hydrogenase maturation endopeptidase [Candidatus Thiodiazotropha taylori]MCW4279303.1 HyaD/HybD family hydrogenase maturation endopeptidase [Candidatus Thiodiazotropha ta
MSLQGRMLIKHNNSVNFRAERMTIERVLILGIGNTLLSDEGIGIHLVTAMQQKIGDIPGVTYMDGGTLSFTLAEPIADADGLIVVDAARMKQPPGALQVFRNEAMDRYLSGNRSSVHEVSLGDLLDIARLSETLPAERCLVGIEPKELDWGESLSDAVAPTVDQGIEAIISILKEWGIFS